MKRCITVLAFLILLNVSGVQAQTPAATNSKQAPTTTQNAGKTDPWLPIRFLLGSWEAKTTGGVAQAQASAGYSFRLELREHVMARHTRSGVCAAPDDFDCQHSDLLYIYSEGNGLKAIFFDNEGHIIHYDISVPKPGTAVFLSDAAQPGPQFRLSYTLLNGAMNGMFEIKMPGQADFSSYLEWSGHQR